MNQMNQILESQQTPNKHNKYLAVSYGVSIVLWLTGYSSTLTFPGGCPNHKITY